VDNLYDIARRQHLSTVFCPRDDAAVDLDRDPLPAEIQLLKKR
jgi:hypothetical protein